MSTWDDLPTPADDDMAAAEHPAAVAGRSGRHPVNVTQLVMAVAFAGMLTIWALFESGVAGSDDFRWLLPLPWLAGGAVGLIATGLPWRRG